MYLPSKSVSADQALLTIGAQVLMQLDRPATVSTLWRRVDSWRKENAMPSTVPFWWFALALDCLYALAVIDYQDGVILRLNHA